MVIRLTTSWVVDVPMSMLTLRISGKGKITSRQKTKKGQDIPRKGCLSFLLYGMTPHPVVRTICF